MKNIISKTCFGQPAIVLFCLLCCYHLNASGKGKEKNKAVIKFGIVSDVHDEPWRLQAFIGKANDEKPDFIIQLGDLSNGKAESNRKMIAIWNTFPGTRYHVLGNHELDYTTKADIIRRQEMPGAYYSFDCGAFHFVVLDCNFIRKDGEFIDFGKANYYIDKESRDLIHPDQVKWLKEDIQKTDKPVILFSHQTFDDITMRGANPVPNRSLIHGLIGEINASSGKHNKIIACFAGHDHIDHYNVIGGVHYFAVNGAYGFKPGLEIKDALYAFVTLNHKKQSISVKGVQSEFMKTPSDKDYGHYDRKLILPSIPDRNVRY